MAEILAANLLVGRSNLNLLLSALGDHVGVDPLAAVLGDRHNEALLLEVDNSSLGDAANNAERLGNLGNGDHPHLGDLLEQLSVGLLVVDDLVVQLLLNASLGPLCLLLFTLQR